MKLILLAFIFSAAICTNAQNYVGTDYVAVNLFIGDADLSETAYDDLTPLPVDVQESDLTTEEVVSDIQKWEELLGGLRAYSRCKNALVFMTDSESLLSYIQGIVYPTDLDLYIPPDCCFPDEDIDHILFEAHVIYPYVGEFAKWPTLADLANALQCT
jgi:hypothetical protein